MLNQINENTDKIIEYVDEIIGCIGEKKKMFSRLAKLDEFYQQKKYGYIKYSKLKSIILKGKTKEYWNKYYDSYIQSLIGELLYHNKQILRETYND